MEELGSGGSLGPLVSVHQRRLGSCPSMADDVEESLAKGSFSPITAVRNCQPQRHRRVSSRERASDGLMDEIVRPG